MFLFFSLTLIAIGLFFSFSPINNIGKLNFYGKAIPFAELKQDGEYQIVTILKNDLIILKKGEDVRIIKESPRELVKMKEGAIFRIRNVSSVTITDGKSSH